MNPALRFAAIGEVATGVLLIAAPSLVASLLLDRELDEIALPIARVAGIALIGLGIACWPGPPLAGMLAYSAAVAAYLAYLGFTGGSIGVLLWPAVILHLILAALLIRPATREPRRAERSPDQ